MKYFRVCPRCGSIDTSHDLSIEAVATKFTTFNYKCNKCGFSAHAFPEMTKEELKKFREKLNN